MEIFDKPQRLMRRLQTQRIISYLSGRWIFSDQTSSASPFWLSPDDCGPPLGLDDYISFLITNQSPDDTWEIGKLDIRPLVIGEQQRLLDTVLRSAQSWSLDSGYVEPGLREVLRICLIVLITGERTRTDIQGIDASVVYPCITRVAVDIGKFDPDVRDWSTMYDLELGFGLLLQFLLNLPTNLVARTPIRNAALLVADRARELMVRGVRSGQERGYLDVLDGVLLPWAMGASPDLEWSQNELFVLAADRFGAAGKFEGLEGDEFDNMSQFPFDAGENPSKTNANADIRRGSYSLSVACSMGRDVASKLEQRDAIIHGPLSELPDVPAEFRSLDSFQPLREDEFGAAA
jgi:hypothetical protein